MKPSDWIFQWSNKDCTQNAHAPCGDTHIFKGILAYLDEIGDQLLPPKMKHDIEVTGTNKIEVNREWLSKLIEIVDKVATAEDEQNRHRWIAHLVGYVHSFNEHLK